MKTISSKLAPFGVREQAPKMPMPANVRVHCDARDFQIIDRLISENPPLLQRIFIAYDPDRDQRTLNVLSAINYSAPALCANIVAMSESNARLRIYYGDPLTISNAQRAFSEACYRALWPSDKWAVDVISVPMREGQLARERLPADSPQHAVLLSAPNRFQYGLIDLRKDGASRDGAL